MSNDNKSPIISLAIVGCAEQQVLAVLPRSKLHLLKRNIIPMARCYGCNITILVMQRRIPFLDPVGMYT